MNGRILTTLLRYSVPSAKLWTEDRGGSEGSGRTKFRGAQRAAEIRARLKLRVERVLRIAPRAIRVKEWVRWTCWIGRFARVRARKMGRRRVVAQVRLKDWRMYCVDLLVVGV